MLIFALVLLVVGFLLAIPLLVHIALILGAVGLVLLLLGAAGGPERRYGGRRYWY